MKKQRQLPNPVLEGAEVHRALDAVAANRLEVNLWFVSNFTALLVNRPNTDDVIRRNVAARLIRLGRSAALER